MSAARSIAWSALLVAATASTALSQDLGDPDSGERLAALNCAPCHGAVDAPAGAPAFATIASMPSTTADGLNVFLQAPISSACARKGVASAFSLAGGFALFKAD